MFNSLFSRPPSWADFQPCQAFLARHAVPGSYRMLLGNVMEFDADTGEYRLHQNLDPLAQAQLTRLYGDQMAQGTQQRGVGAQGRGRDRPAFAPRHITPPFEEPDIEMDQSASPPLEDRLLSPHSNTEHLVLSSDHEYMCSL